MTVSDAPIVTVGIVVLNREWIIGEMLRSLLNQSYPHDKISVIVVDGCSKDRTVEIAEKILDTSGFMSYEIISRKCNIPEGRNICIDRMKGEMLFFWDSDVILEPNALSALVRTSIQKNAEIVSTRFNPILLESKDQFVWKPDKTLAPHEASKGNDVVEANCVVMGHTIIWRRVFGSIRFDPDLTFVEDLDFSIRARRNGFKILLDNSVKAFDVNIRKKEYSDIYVDMSLKNSLRGLRKKAEVHVLAYSLQPTFKDMILYFLTYKRFAFYLGYIPITILTLYGLLINNYFILALPIYISIFSFLQIRKRGLKQGLRSLLKSIVVGVPFSLCLTYYFIKHILRK